MTLEEKIEQIKNTKFSCEQYPIVRFNSDTMIEELHKYYHHIQQCISSTNNTLVLLEWLINQGLSEEVAKRLITMVEEGVISDSLFKNPLFIETIKNKITEFKNDGTFDELIRNQLEETYNLIDIKMNQIRNEILDLINNVNNKVSSKLKEVDNRITVLQNFETHLSVIDSKNVEQDVRLKDIEYKNKVQDVKLQGLFNENNDGRLSIEGEGNSLKLECSKKGLVEVEKVVGNTMVNHYHFNSSDDFFSLNSNIITTNNNIKIIANGTYQNAMLKPIQTLKTSTDYTIIVNVIKNTINGIMSITTNAIDAQLPGLFTIDVGKTGQLVQKITSNADFTNCNRALVTFLDISATQGEIEFNILILEGDYTNKPIPSEYIEGMQSTFEENIVTQEMIDEGLEEAENLGKYKYEVEVKGKNLFDGELEKGGIAASTGLNVVTNDRIRSLNYIEVNSNTITISRNTNVGICYVYSYDSNYRFIELMSSVIQDGQYSQTFTLNKLTKYIRFANKDTLNLDIQYQIEEGTEATPYEPPYHKTKTVYLNSPLYKNDELVVENGELKHWHKSNIKKISISDVVGLDNTSYSNISYVKIYVPNDYVNNEYIEGLLTADKFFTPSQHSNWNDISLVGGIFSSATKIQWWVGVDNTTTLEQAKLLVDGTKVLYPISEPYYEKIDTNGFLMEIPNSATITIKSVVPVQNVKATYTTNTPNLYEMVNVNKNQDNLINVSLLATDELYTLIEPLIENITESVNLKSLSSFVFMYKAMVERKLKNIENVPLKFRENVQALIKD